MEIKGDHYKYILSLSKEVHHEPIRLSDQGQVEKAESSPLCIRESTISSVEPMRLASQPKFLLLSSTLPFAFAGIWLGGQTRGVCLYHGHICLPGLTDVSVGKLGCCQLRGFPFGLLIFARTLLQSSGSCGNILFKNPTRQNLEAPYIRPLSYRITGGVGVSGPGPHSPN